MATYLFTGCRRKCYQSASSATATTLETCIAFIVILQTGQTSSIPVAAAKATFIPSSRTPAATDLRSKSYSPPAVLPVVCQAVIFVGHDAACFICGLIIQALVPAIGQQVLRHKGDVGAKLLHCISQNVLHLPHRSSGVGTVGKKLLRLLLPVYWMFTQPGGYP